MNNFLSLLLAMHVVSGFISLLVAPIALVTKKGSKTHRLWGKIYFISLTIVCFTAFVISVNNHMPHLLILAVFSYYLVFNGYRSIFLKGLHRDQQVFIIDWFLNVSYLIFSLGLMYWILFTSETKENLILSLVVGVAGIFLSFHRMIQFVFRPSDRNHWFFNHMIYMILSFIVACTAFTVVNLRFVPEFLNWLLPSFVGMPILFLLIKKYKTKFSKRKSLEEL